MWAAKWLAALPARNAAEPEANGCIIPAARARVETVRGGRIQGLEHAAFWREPKRLRKCTDIRMDSEITRALFHWRMAERMRNRRPMRLPNQARANAMSIHAGAAATAAEHRSSRNVESTCEGNRPIGSYGRRSNAWAVAEVSPHRAQVVRSGASLLVPEPMLSCVCVRVCVASDRSHVHPSPFYYPCRWWFDRASRLGASPGLGGWRGLALSAAPFPEGPGGRECPASPPPKPRHGRDGRGCGPLGRESPELNMKHLGAELASLRKDITTGAGSGGGRRSRRDEAVGGLVHSRPRMQA